MDESREEDRSAVLFTQDKGRQFRREAEQEGQERRNAEEKQAITR